MASSAKVGWQKEREAKQKQKEWESQQNAEHKDWQQKRADMMKKKEAAETKAKEAEASAPEFLKKLGNMKEKAQNKPPPKKEDEGPTIEELDDGTDIPPWHRPNAPEKPEWVVLLLMAAEKEAQEEGGEDDDDVFCASGAEPSLRYDNLPPESSGSAASDEPAWMKQAKSLKSTPNLTMDSKKSKKHTRRNSFDISGHNPEKQEQPWMMNASLKPAKSTRQVSDTTSTTSPKIVRSPRKTPNKYASKSASADVLMGDEKPEWMKSAEKLRKKKKPVINHEANNPAAPPAEDLPEWMTQRSKIQQQQKTSSPDEKSLRGSTNSIASTTSTANEDEQQQPAWMIQRSKIKQKTDLTPPPSPTRKTNNAGDNKPDWMKHHLVPEPRISIDDLKTSIVQEKLELREPIRQASIRLTKEELTDNVVKQKLEKRPSIVDHRKSQVKPEEMEWMKKKLKKSTATSQPETSSLKKEPADDKKPEWMKHRDKLIPRVSAQELQKSVVQEKLHSRGPIRESSLRNICKAELTDNKVMTKLAQRPSLLDKKSHIQTEEMEWMKTKLRPKSVPNTPDDGDDDRPQWMKETQKRRSSRKLLDASDIDASIRESKKEDKEEDKRPQWMKETQKRRSSRRSMSLTDSEHDKKEEESEDGKKPLRRSATVDERAPKRQPAWMNAAEQRLNAKGLIGNENEIHVRRTSMTTSKPESPKATTQTVTKPATTPKSPKPTTQTITKPTPPKSPRTTTQTTAKPAPPPKSPKPATQTIAKPTPPKSPRTTTQTIAKPATPPKSPKPTTQTISKPAPPKSPKPTTKTVTKPTPPKSPKPTTQTITKPAPPKTPQKTTQAITKPTAKPTAKPAAKPTPPKSPKRTTQTTSKPTPTKSPKKKAEPTPPPAEPASRQTSWARVNSPKSSASKAAIKRAQSPMPLDLERTEKALVEINSRSPKQAVSSTKAKKSTKNAAAQAPLDVERTTKALKELKKSQTQQQTPTKKQQAKKSPKNAVDTPLSVERTEQALMALNNLSKQQTPRSKAETTATPQKTAMQDRGSFSLTDDTDALSSDQGEKSPAKPPGDGRFWQSLISLGSTEGSMSTDSETSGEKPSKAVDFSASMNDISAVKKPAEKRRRRSSRKSISSSGSRLKSRSRSKSMDGRKKKSKDEKKKSEKKERRKSEKKDKKKESKKETKKAEKEKKAKRQDK